MANKYAGICYRCGQRVDAGAGVFEKVSFMQAKKWPGRGLPRWLTQHHDCAVQWRGTAQHYLFNDMRKETAK